MQDCGCNKSSAGMVESNPEYKHWKGSQKLYSLRMIDNEAIFYPPDPCKEITFGEECVSVPELVCQINKHCHSCIPPCAYGQFGLLVDDCSDCCDDYKCRGIVANFLVPCEKSSDHCNIIGELWTFMVLANGSKILLKSRPASCGKERCGSFEIRRRCDAFLSCDNMIVTHTVSTSQDVICTMGCLKDRTGCADVCGYASLDLEEGKSLCETLKYQKDDGYFCFEIDMKWKLCLTKEYCDKTPSPELTC